MTAKIVDLAEWKTAHPEAVRCAASDYWSMWARFWWPWLFGGK